MAHNRCLTQPVYLACAIYQIKGFRQCHDPHSNCTGVFIRFVSIGEQALPRVAVLEGWYAEAVGSPRA